MRLPAVRIDASMIGRTAIVQVPGGFIRGCLSDVQRSVNTVLLFVDGRIVVTKNSTQITIEARRERKPR